MREGGIRAIIVDDSRGMRRLSRKVLGQLVPEMRFAEADCADALLRELEHSTFDVIFLDINMPGMSGLECLKVLRESGLRTPVIMCSANQKSGIVDEALELGAAGYIVKPISRPKMVVTLSEMLANSSAGTGGSKSLRYLLSALSRQ